MTQPVTSATPAQVDRIATQLGPAIDRASNDPTAVSLGDSPTEVAQTRAAIAAHIAADPNLLGKLAPRVTYKMVIAFLLAGYIEVKIILGQLPFNYHTFDIITVGAGAGAVGYTFAALVQRKWPSLLAFFKGYAPADTVADPSDAGDDATG